MTQRVSAERVAEIKAALAKRTLAALEEREGRQARDYQLAREVDAALTVGQALAIIDDLEESRKTAAGYLSHIHEIKREWEQDTATLSRTAENWRARTHRLETLRSEAQPQWERLLGALRAVEWGGPGQENCCPFCGNWKIEGHIEDCLVGNTLAATEATSG